MFVWKIVASYIHHITCYRWLVGFPNMTGFLEAARPQGEGSHLAILKGCWKTKRTFWGFSVFFSPRFCFFLLFLGAGRTPLSIFDDRWNQCIKNGMLWVVSGRSHRFDLAATWVFFGRSAWEVTSTNMAMRRYPDIGKVGDSSAAENLNLQLTWACI